METSKRIYMAARREFLLFGFHASNLQRIAASAGVLRPAIHYHYRSKTHLYELFVQELAKDFFDKMGEISSFYYERKSEYVWFLLTEMHNNRAMLLSAFNKSSRKDWKSLLIELFLSEHQNLTMIFRLTGQSLLSLNPELPDLQQELLV